MSTRRSPNPLGRAARAAVAVVVVIVGTGLVPPNPAVGAPVRRVSSSVIGSDGKPYVITNHLTPIALAAERRGAPAREWLLVWTGDAEPGPDGRPDPDFLAVIDATAGSPDYGKVVNTVTVDSVFGNEPHHMQYTWRKGDKVYAGGLLSDTVFIFDVSRLPRVSLSGVTLPQDTPCGSVPDAFTVLADGTAYGTYMGGPDVAGPCTYSDGQTRIGNGYAGSPGEVVRLAPDGTVLAEIPASRPVAEDPASCPNEPVLPVPTCANPHGIALREDLNRLITSDFVEVRHIVHGAMVTDPGIQRRTVRTYDISDRARPRLLSLSYLPDGPRVDDEFTREGMLVMEPAVTNRPQHRGAFAATGMGAIYYTPDITRPQLTWRQVFDDHTAFRRLFPKDTPTSAADGGGWLMVSPDDRFLFHTVMAGGVDSPQANAEAGMLYVLDIRRLLAAGARTTCRIDTIAETVRGGDEPDCPALVDALPIVDTTIGGPHWGTLDTFQRVGARHYRQTDRVFRVATSNYFVAATGLDGDDRICMTLVSPAGRLTRDRAFRDEHTGEGCVNFDRTSWPHGETGRAHPHGLLFAVADAQLR